ncbi:MAG: MBL fold metallo-hydrolase [Planctomycetes bacterium]|nr:MBL fold metallo-hydrolase [Planctomycetota bacterium]
MFVWRDDLHVPAADLWLDPGHRKARAFVSHAHGDHIGRHQQIWATKATAALMRARLGPLQITELPFGEWCDVGGGCRLRLHPAGHILGAAQVEIVRGSERLVYTGDFRLERSETCEPAAIVPCDVLVMECTFGRPHYRFPPRSEVVPLIAADLRAVLAGGGTPILLAYALGRGQELMKLLEPHGFELALAPALHAMVKIYEEQGVRFGPYELARPGQTRGKVVLVPPHASTSQLVLQAQRPVLIAATGWARDGAPPYRADRSYALSDHADFDELLRYVTVARPREVYTVHGFDEFRDHLRERGIFASPVTARVVAS